MLDQHFALIKAHRRNIERYRKLLRTALTDIETRFIEGRIRQEQASLYAIATQLMFVRSEPSGRPALGPNANLTTPDAPGHPAVAAKRQD